jgi:AAHS family 4-hydroxybenzoate transporter-like MFS transporter
MLVNFFLNSWLPLVLTDIGFSAKQAAGTASLYYVGGICGGLIMGLALDYVGPAMLGLYSIFGCLITALIGIPSGSPIVTYFLVGLVGFSVLGAQVGMSAIAGLLYPTTMRSKGAGFAHSVGRLGAIGGPLLAGFLIAKNTSFLALFLVPVVPLICAALGFFLITRVWTGRLRGRGLADIKQLGQSVS